ncbi:MAG: putative tricarboxylic transport rane protein [Clostridia bacterium]|nr:putative tricarboxylic transport rane protein [Clostridia bacterium]
MELLQNLLQGLEITFTWQGILAVAAGVFIGILFGLTPGLDATSGVALMLPFTYPMPATIALLFLGGLYCAASYAGSITAICLGVPGTPAAAATALDGYPLMKKGRAGEALFVSLYSSVIGGLISTVFLVLLMGPLVKMALSFGPAEYFSLALFGLTVIASLVGRQFIKGFIVAVLGLLISTVGMDAYTSYPRFTFGIPELFEGISFVPAMVGLFAVSEALVNLEKLGAGRVVSAVANRIPGWKEIKKLHGIILINSFIGSFLGALPGVGAATACWVSYNQAQRMSKHPEKFGTGILEGVAAPESSNNATVSTALAPLLALGVPGSATAAVLLGALIMHGLQPGPELFKKAPDVVYALLASLFVANIIMGILGYFGIRLWTSFLKLPIGVLTALIFGFAFLGAFGVRYTLIDVIIMLAFGFLGYILRKFEFPLPPLVLALVLGFMVEDNFRRALMISNNGALIFVTKPLSLVFLILAILSLFAPYIQTQWAIRKARREGKTVEEALEEVSRMFSD